MVTDVTPAGTVQVFAPAVSNVIDKGAAAGAAAGKPNCIGLFIIKLPP
jgi:hypothetical protein